MPMLRTARIIGGRSAQSLKEGDHFGALCRIFQTREAHQGPWYHLAWRRQGAIKGRRMPDQA